MKAEIRIPTTQYGYISFFPEGLSPEGIIKAHNELVKAYKDSLKTPSVEPDLPPTSSLNLKPTDLLKLLYKPLCGGGLTMEEVDSLGTEKIYSQKDVLKIVQSLINKSKREEEKLEETTHNEFMDKLKNNK